MKARRVSLIVCFALFAGSIIFSLAGMTALKLAPAAVASVGPWLPQLQQWPTWVYVATLPLCVLLVFWPVLGARRSLFFALWGAGVGAAAELIGTSTGLPFGEYSYTGFLGARIADRVPWAIPPSWYAAALLAFAFAAALGQRGPKRVMLAAFFLVLWDVGLDPAMSAGFPVWVWHQEGPFYGMPLLNWAGWFVTGLVIMAGFERFAPAGMAEAGQWPAAIWLVNGVFAIGICVITGLHLATLTGTVALLLPVALVLWRRTAPRPAACRAPLEA